MARSGGDIPIEGDTLSPTTAPKVKQRFGQKDLTLFQFNQEFKQRFAEIWNLKQRWLPPSSPLRPGQVVFYEVYINSDGTMNKYENLSAKQNKQVIYGDIDSIVEDVLKRVFPISVPGVIKNEQIVSQVIAIQVVGSNVPISFSF